MCELYLRVRTEQPALVPVVEAFISDVLSDLSARHAECERLEALLARCAPSHVSQSPVQSYYHTLE